DVADADVVVPGRVEASPVADRDVARARLVRDECDAADGRVQVSGDVVAQRLAADGDVSTARHVVRHRVETDRRVRRACRVAGERGVSDRGDGRAGQRWVARETEKRVEYRPPGNRVVTVRIDDEVGAGDAGQDGDTADRAQWHDSGVGDGLAAGVVERRDD